MAQMKYFYELTISSSPHAHSPVTTQTIMRDVLIALVPALLGSIYFFGFRALLVTLVSAAACVFFEWGFCKIRKLHCKTYDLSAVVTGVLLAFVCPVTIPYWTIILGDFFAIVLVKMLFGGLGKNIVNPALAGRAFLFSWPVLMSNWVKVGFDNAAGLLSTADAVTAATPMSAMHQRRAAGGIHPGHVPGQHRRLHRRNLRTAADHRLYLPAVPQGHHRPDSFGLHRHRGDSGVPVPPGQ